MAEPAPKPAPVTDPAGKPVPLTFKDATIPEGFTIKEDDDIAKEVLATFNDEKLDSKGRFNAMVGLLPKIQQRIASDNERTWVELNDQWRGEIEKQHGAQLPDKLAKVGGMIESYARDMQGRQAPGTPPVDYAKMVREAATMTGAGNNPAWFNFVSWAADKLGEGAPLTGAPAGGSKDRASVMFGGQK